MDILDGSSPLFDNSTKVLRDRFQLSEVGAVVAVVEAASEMDVSVEALLELVTVFDVHARHGGVPSRDRVGDIREVGGVTEVGEVCSGSGEASRLVETPSRHGPEGPGVRCGQTGFRLQPPCEPPPKLTLMPVRRAPIPTASLTKREAEVISMVTDGLSNDEIATGLFLTINSVKSVIRSGYRKIGVTSRVGAVLWGVDHGLRSAHSHQ